jgi:hypothetical protein
MKCSEEETRDLNTLTVDTQQTSAASGVGAHYASISHVPSCFCRAVCVFANLYRRRSLVHVVRINVKQITLS